MRSQPWRDARQSTEVPTADTAGARAPRTEFVIDDLVFALPLSDLRTPIESAPPLLGDIRQLMDHRRQRLASTVNGVLTLSYWHIG